MIGSREELPVAMDRPAQAGTPAGRHRRRASELLILFSNHYGTPDQCGSDARSLAHQPVSRAVHNGLREVGDGHPCSYAPLPRPTHGSGQEIARAQQIHPHGEWFAATLKRSHLLPRPRCAPRATTRPCRPAPHKTALSGRTCKNIGPSSRRSWAKTRDR
jgi:hypothetical protein